MFLFIRKDQEKDFGHQKIRKTFLTIRKPFWPSEKPFWPPEKPFWPSEKHFCPSEKGFSSSENGICPLEKNVIHKGKTNYGACELRAWWRLNDWLSDCWCLFFTKEGVLFNSKLLPNVQQQIVLSPMSISFILLKMNSSENSFFFHN